MASPRPTRCSRCGEVPWHGLGVVLDEYPKSIDEALDKAGLGWKVTHGDVLVVKAPEWIG